MGQTMKCGTYQFCECQESRNNNEKPSNGKILQWCSRCQFLIVQETWTSSCSSIRFSVRQLTLSGFLKADYCSHEPVNAKLDPFSPECRSVSHTIQLSFAFRHVFNLLNDSSAIMPTLCSRQNSKRISEYRTTVVVFSTYYTYKVDAENWNY